MIIKQPKKQKSRLDKEIMSLEDQLEYTPFDSDEYKYLLEVYSRLTRLRREEKESKKFKVSPDTVLMVSANLLGIILILGYEQAHVVTSKALGFVLKGRV